MVRVGLLLIGLFFTLGITAHERFLNYTIEDGLSNNSVRLIFQDRDGFLWVGTLNGLNRYDGYKFKEYHHQPGDANSLQNNRIMNMVQDGGGIFYLVTFDGNIHQFDASLNRFVLVNPLTELKEENFRAAYVVQSSKNVFWFISANNGCVRLISDAKYPNGFKVDHFNHSKYLTSDTVNFVYPALNGEVWIGTSKGLLALPSDSVDLSPEAVQSFFSSRKGKSFVSVKEINGYIWFGSVGEGAVRYDIKTKKFVENPIPALSSSTVSCIEAYSDHVLLGTRDAGLYVYDSKLNVVKQFTEGNSDLNSNYISSFFYDQNGLFWLVTSQRGVTLFDFYESSFTYYPLNVSRRASLGESDKQLFYRDSHGDMWIGIYGGGLSRYNRLSRDFEQYMYSSSDPYGISSDYVLSILEDCSQNLWVGTYNGGINKLNIRKGVFNSIVPEPGAASVLTNEVRAVFEDSNGNLLAGSKGGGLYKFRKAGSVFNPVSIQPMLDLPVFRKGIYCLYEDFGKNLWIGTKGDGVFVVRAADRDKTNPPMLRFNQPGTIGVYSEGSNVYSIIQDKFGHYWIATYSGGLYELIDPFTNPRLINYIFDSKDPHSLSDNRIRQLMFDKNDNLWIATSGGVNVLKAEYLDSPTKKFVRIVNQPGQNASISNNDVMCILQHSDGKIYMGTFGGGVNILDEYNLDSNFYKWRYLMKSQGVSSNVINCMVEDPKGNLWFTTDNGIDCYNPQTGKIDLYFERDGINASIFSESAGIRTQSGDILFGHSNGLIMFNPLNLKKDSTVHNVFITGVQVNNGRSLVLGEETRLKHSENTLTFEFSSLDFSSSEKNNYSFILENFDDEWSVPLSQNSVTYRGLPPGSYTFKVRATNSDGVWMPAIPVYSFVIAPPFWNSVYAYLIYISIIAFGIWFYYKLKFKQLKLEQELQYNEKINEQKLQYYTNISHEFKTPLTLILNPVDDIIESDQATPKIKERAIQIKKNAGYLLHLIEQILDFRRFHEDKANLKIVKVNLSQFFNDIYQVFLPLAQRKKIDMSFSCAKDNYNGYIDCSFFEKICYNLLSNALKHTPVGKGISFVVDVDESTNQVVIIVKDQGHGIAADQIDKIFERFYKSQDSTGLGLFFTRELVTWHGGTISVRSVEGEWSEFTVRIPIGRPKGFVDSESSEGVHLLKDAENVEMKYCPELDEISMGDTKKVSSRKETLLLVEDNSNLLSFLMDKLSDAYNVVGAENGRVALEKTRNNTIDLIVCDYMMPEMDGIETLKRLKSDINTSHIPVILLTAIASEEKMLEAMEMGADDYITKPFNMNHLQVRIENLIIQRKRLRHVFSHAPEFSATDVPGVNADKEFIETVTKVVDENIGNADFSVDLIADKLNMSRTVFYKKMKLVSGYSPNEFIQLIRMKKAAFLIKNSNLSISEIGMQVGFSDSNYFSKCFKNHFGMPPSVYQKHEG